MAGLFLISILAFVPAQTPVAVPNSSASGQTINAAAINANFTVVAMGTVPVGTIIPSILTQAQMDALNGIGVWVITTGQAAPRSFKHALGISGSN